jgi:hypothetical protein
MLDADSRAAPQYAGFSLWQDAGDTILPVDGGDDGVGVYATKRSDGAAVVMMINRDAEARHTSLSVDSMAAMGVAARAMRAPTLTSTELVSELPVIGDSGNPAAPADGPPNVPPTAIDLGVHAAPLPIVLAPWSITVLVLTPA